MMGVFITVITHGTMSIHTYNTHIIKNLWAQYIIVWHKNEICSLGQFSGSEVGTNTMESYNVQILAMQLVSLPFPAASDNEIFYVNHILA